MKGGNKPKHEFLVTVDADLPPDIVKRQRQQ